ncbi:Uracil-DNA glycosylase [Buchnera aphidicola (Panaphis juglandis)]
MINLLNWKHIFHKNKSRLLKILNIVSQERRKKTIYPNKFDVFNAFRFTPFHKIKIVIIGQDPYYNFNQAHGLAFSVQEGCVIPPSLINIYKEIINDLSLPKNYYNNGDLTKWAIQGVFLLNTILTVESGKPKSHSNIGWQEFTDSVIQYINDYLNGVVFLLWGNSAQMKKRIINHNHHLVLCASHPSPLSAYLGFFGCCHFSKSNIFLKNQNRCPILW